MKTFRFIASAFAALLLATTLTGCSDDSFEDSSESVAGQQSVIGFGTYLSRATATRGTPYLEPAEIALGGGVGVFAMQTEGKKYDPTVTDGSATTDFDANLMQNIHLQSTLTDEQLQSTDANVADNWTYAPVRYWPKGTSDYASFMAYAPYSEDYGTLYDKDGQTTGDRTYIRHTVAPDPRDHTDLLYGDPANTTNMQLRRNADNTWAETGTFYTPTGSSDAVPSVSLKLKHALSRIGFVVTSSALKSNLNYHYTDSAGVVVSAPADGIHIGIAFMSWPVYSDIFITVNKIVFLGDNKSAEEDPATGTFTKTAYLNLSNASESKPLWCTASNDGKAAFTFDNNDTIRTHLGEYNEGKSIGTITLYNDLDGSSIAIDKYNNYLWVPNENIISYYPDTYWSELRESYEELYEWWGYSEEVAKKLAEEIVNGEIETNIKSKDIHGEWRDPDEYPEDKIFFVNTIGNANNDYMFLIPQTFSKNGSNDLWVYLDYTVYYETYNEYQQYRKTYGVSGDVTKGINYKVYTKLNKDNDISFEAGKAYLIFMDIGDGQNFNSISFSVQEASWPNEIIK